MRLACSQHHNAGHNVNQPVNHMSIDGLVLLEAEVRNGQVGVTTVGEIRKAGGDVVRTSGRSPYHATLTGLTSEQISELFVLTIPNPAREN